MYELPTRSGRVLAVTCTGMFLVLLDVTIVNVALPDISRELRAGTAQLQWVVDAYVVALAGLLLAGGTIGDRIGHKRVLLTGFALFGAASLACATAPSVLLLIAARVGQGIGAALLLPATMAVIVDVYPGGAEQARALGIWAAASSLALPCGPVLGGLLVSAWSWRSVFWIVLPCTVLAFVAAAVLIPDPGRRASGAANRVDVLGLAGFVVGLGAAVFAIVSLGHGAGAGVVALAFGLAVAALAVAVASSRRAPNPVLPLDLLARPHFFAPNVVALVMNLVVNGVLFVTMLYLQSVRQFSPMAAGVAVLPLALPLVVLAPLSGRLTARYGPRPVVAVGCVSATLGTPLVAGVRADGGTGWLLAGYALLGSGAGLVTTAVVSAVMRAVPPERAGLGTGVSNTSRQIGTASGVALFGMITGAPTTPHFLAALHLSAVVGGTLWLAALGITLGFIPRRSRPALEAERTAAGRPPPTPSTSGVR